MIQVGDKIPDVAVKLKTRGGIITSFLPKIFEKQPQIVLRLKVSCAALSVLLSCAFIISRSSPYLMVELPGSRHWSAGYTRNTA